MHTKDAIKFALTVSNGAVLSVIDEMSDAATTFPTPNGGCHPLWVLGHLALVEGMIPAAFSETRILRQSGNNTSARTRNRSPMPARIHRSPRFGKVSSIARTEPEASRVAERGRSRQADQGAAQRTGAGVRHLRAELPRAGAAPDDASRQRDRRCHGCRAGCAEYSTPTFA